VFQGNSGSPIISIKDWRVLGIMAYARKVNANGEWIKDSIDQSGAQIKSHTRYFGFRFDTVKSWYPIRLETWRQQCAFIEEKHQRIRAVTSFYMNSNLWQTDKEISEKFAACKTAMSKLNGLNSRKSVAATFLQFLQQRVETDARHIQSFEASAYPFLKDEENNFGECSVRIRNSGAKAGEFIKNKNGDIISNITGRYSS
jgi:hypothetical protein